MTDKPKRKTIKLKKTSGPIQVEPPMAPQHVERLRRFLRALKDGRKLGVDDHMFVENMKTKHPTSYWRQYDEVNRPKPTQPRPYRKRSHSRQTAAE